MMRNIVIFGAGDLGRRAIRKYGKEKVNFLVDNDVQKQYVPVMGIEVYPPDRLLSEPDCKIVIAVKQSKTIAKQIEDMGILNYEVYSDNSYFDIPEVVYNPYAKENFSAKNRQLQIQDIKSETRELLKTPQRLFNHIEIETINRCNGICRFCPVNRNNDIREFHIMDEQLFVSIIDQLAEMRYKGKIALFSNNEPLLDDRIIEFHKYMRKKLPSARAHLCTNGTLLTLEKFIELMKCLDELMIDNYNQELRLIPNSLVIKDYCEKHDELKSKVTIILRKPDEVLTSRGGDAPNAMVDTNFADVPCMLPFKQMIVRPDGKISLCCNDALGKCTLGDLTQQSLKDAWFSSEFSHARAAIGSGRGNLPRCRWCDTLYFC